MINLRKALVLPACLALGMSLLAGCGSSTSSNTGDGGTIIVANSPSESTSDADKTPLAEASDFSFDFESMEYSFTGAENAEFYYIKVYPVVNGEESNSASFQSDKIEANDTNSYTGTIEGETLLAGDYIAHVVASASGYSSSDIQISGSSYLMASCSVSANWNTGSDEDPTVTADITVTPGDEISQTFTIVITNEAGETVYTNEAATAEPINLTAADLGAEELTVEDVYNVTVTVNEVDGYKVPANAAETTITEQQMWGPPM